MPSREATTETYEEKYLRLLDTAKLCYSDGIRAMIADLAELESDKDRSPILLNNIRADLKILKDIVEDGTEALSG